MKKRLLQTPRGQVCYWVSEPFLPGRRTLVFLHGLTADHTLFEKQTPAFEGEYNLILWDAPAHGLSRPYQGFTYPHAAEDLENILTENGVGPAVMIGQSMGGYIIQSFLRRCPQRVEGFIGIDTCPYGEGYYSRSDKWWLRQVGWMAALYPLGLLKKAMAAQCARTEEGRQNMRAALAPYGKAELCRLMGIGFGGFLEDNGELHIPCPVLLLVGEQDRTGKVRAYCDAWAKREGYPLTVIKNAAHNSNRDAPAAVNDAIRRFLGQLPG